MEASSVMEALSAMKALSAMRALAGTEELPASDRRGRPDPGGAQNAERWWPPSTSIQLPVT